MASRTDSAVEYFAGGFNCAQSMAIAFCDKYAADRETMARMTCGLGGGMRSGEVCGAISGAVLVIGLASGQARMEDRAAKKNCYAKTSEFMGRLKAGNQPLTCRQILGCDISNREGHERAIKAGLFKTKCVDMVRKIGGLLEELGY
ncbi:MAG: C-GCAxxG-C-C family protein [Planctomycetota bacterium]|jgi:C_GCAxxG_C_C family probable redox protein|nr:C-GCAxxG-C-C family protein [Planctomycetota bacterium]